MIADRGSADAAPGLGTGAGLAGAADRVDAARALRSCYCGWR